MKPHNSIVALLPIKAHSARIPGKNFRSFAGKPLFRWILESLTSIPEIKLIVVNTDARSILKQHGLTDSERILIRDRKVELCGDFTSMNLVLADDVSNVPSDTYLMTHSTNPLLSPNTIRRAILSFEKILDEGKGDSLFSVNQFQTRFYRSDATPVNHDPKNLIRTQDLEPWYEENSNLYLFSSQSFHKTNARIGEKPVLFETPREESFDIDDPAGWNIAERLALAPVQYSESEWNSQFSESL